MHATRPIMPLTRPAMLALLVLTMGAPYSALAFDPNPANRGDPKPLPLELPKSSPAASSAPSSSTKGSGSASLPPTRAQNIPAGLANAIQSGRTTPPRDIAIEGTKAILGDKLGPIPPSLFGKPGASGSGTGSKNDAVFSLGVGQKSGGGGQQSGVTAKIVLPAPGEKKSLGNGITVDTNGNVTKDGAFIAKLGENGKFSDASGKQLPDTAQSQLLGVFGVGVSKLGIAGKIGGGKGKPIAAFEQKNDYVAAADPATYYGRRAGGGKFALNFGGLGISPDGKFKLDANGVLKTASGQLIGKIDPTTGKLLDMAGSAVASNKPEYQIYQDLLGKQAGQNPATAAAFNGAIAAAAASSGAKNTAKPAAKPPTTGGAASGG